MVDRFLSPQRALLLLGHSILLETSPKPDECSPVYPAGICGHLRPSATSPSDSSKPMLVPEPPGTLRGTLQQGAGNDVKTMADRKSVVVFTLLM